MDWNRVEGNWKQVAGKVKEKWGKLTLTSPPSTVAAISSKERSRSVMASPKIRSRRTLTTGMASSPGSHALKSVFGPAFCRAFF